MSNPDFNPRKPVRPGNEPTLPEIPPGTPKEDVEAAKELHRSLVQVNSPTLRTTGKNA